MPRSLIATATAFLLLLTAAPLRLLQAQTAPGGGEALSFETLAALVEQNSLRLQSARGEEEAARLARDRLARHWLPRLYIDSRLYRTNDALASFGARLQERQVESADLSLPATPLEIYQNSANFLRPDTLNHPAPSSHGTAGAGIEWRFYEGGASDAAARAAQQQALARMLDRRQTALAEYAGAAIAYSELLSVDRENGGVLELRSASARILRGYQLGAASNPVGRAGLLALQAHDNRLQARLLEHEALRKSARESLAVAAGDLPSGWALRSENPMDFADRCFPQDIVEAEETPSLALQSALANADAARAQAEGSENVLRPQAGVFGEARYNAGARGAADSYQFGLYFKMNLYSPVESGLSAEARARADAAETRARDAARREAAQRRSYRESLVALRKGLLLIQENQRLLAQQSLTALRLYRDGAITALQLADAHSRRADVLFEQARVEREYVRLRAALYLLNGANISQRQESQP
ncbi:MAG: TolC family protein [Leptospirales bacterium]|nr:TolC family protein [Leptospirales bacterium]